ncbi:MAG: hypothetical protein HW421_2651 [Ignavibacteria bacterium]|nr:hypothetical protein [Ignavibacteria bacterium]
MKDYINITISIPEEDYDQFYAASMDLPIEGIEEKFDELIICFEKDKLKESVHSEIINIVKYFGEKAKIISEDCITEKNWNEEWEKSVAPVMVSERIAIVPEWRKEEVDCEIKIVVNPKMSFGTGHHCSTRLMCRLMEESESLARCRYRNGGSRYSCR